MTPSDTLAEVVGSKAMPRTEVTKKLWAYIKKNGLQDKKNRRMINADDNLKAVFGGKASVNMFAMTKLVSALISRRFSDVSCGFRAYTREGVLRYELEEEEEEEDELGEEEEEEAEVAPADLEVGVEETPLEALAAEEDTEEAT